MTPNVARTKVVIEFTLDDDRVDGVLTRDGGEAVRPFAGWLELLALLKGPVDARVVESDA